MRERKEAGKKMIARPGSALKRAGLFYCVRIEVTKEVENGGWSQEPASRWELAAEG